MALVRSLSKAFISKNVHFLLSKTVPVSTTSVKSMAYWNKDWTPGPHPKNEAEKRAAAKKYGLLPEDYEPHSEGDGYGDYPKLPVVSVEARDPDYLWDIKHLRRDFGEPMHVDADILIEERHNPDIPMPYSKLVILFSFFGIFGFVILFFALSPERDRVKTMKPIQFYTPGVTHYTFQLEGQEDDHHDHH